jgi:NitT/TauT family transport system substrate-binding protein
MAVSPLARMLSGMKHLILGLITALCLLLVACAPPVAGVSLMKLQNISIGIVTPSAAHAPMLVALGKDYFQDVGLQVDLQQFPNLTSATAALATGQLDLAATAPSAALFNGINQGLQTKIVSALGAFPSQGEPAALVVRKALVDSGQVNTLVDLRGRRIGLGGGKAGVQGYIAELLVQPVGLTLNDFDVVDLGFPDAVAALSSNAVDAAYLPEPFKSQAVRQGIATVIARPENIGHSPVVTLYSQKLIAEKPEIAKAAMVALVRGARDLQGDGAKAEENLASISKYTKLPLDTLQSMDLYTYDPDLTPDTDMIMGMQQMLMGTGLLDYSNPLPAERLIDVSFSQYAAAQLGSYKGR